MSTSQVTYRGGRMESVQVCQSCGHNHFPGDNYAYVIHGLPEHLKDKIDDAIRICLGEDTTNLSVEVVEMAE